MKTNQLEILCLPRTLNRSIKGIHFIGNVGTLKRGQKHKIMKPVKVMRIERQAFGKNQRLGIRAVENKSRLGKQKNIFLVFTSGI